MKDYNRDCDGRCVTCNNYELTTNWNSIHSGIGFRCRKHGWQDPFDHCGSYEKGCYSNAYIEECLESYMKKKRYYIVTTVCNLMGLPEDNEYRSTFASTIEEYLIGTKDGEQLLADYDCYGSLVAQIIEREYYSGDKESIIELIQNDIMPEFDKMLNCMKNDKVDRAILRYIVMTRRLMDRFEIYYSPVKPIYEETTYSPFHNTLLAFKRTKK